MTFGTTQTEATRLKCSLCAKNVAGYADAEIPSESANTYTTRDNSVNYVSLPFHYLATGLGIRIRMDPNSFSLLDSDPHLICGLTEVVPNYGELFYIE